MKLKIIIEVECDKAGNLGKLSLEAKSPARGGPVLRHTFLQTTPPKARELAKLCFDLERLASEAAEKAAKGKAV